MPFADYFTLAFYGPGAAAARLAGTGTLAAAVKGNARAGAALAGVGTVSTADLTAGKTMAAALAGVGTVTDAAPKGRARAVATISIGSRPSAEDVAQAVWGASKNINAETGTTVEALRNASSAGDPWTTTIEAGMSAAEILRIIAAALAGPVSGAGTTTITIKGLDGTTDRITATVDGEGNRAAVVVDGDA